MCIEGGLDKKSLVLHFSSLTQRIDLGRALDSLQKTLVQAATALIL